MLVWLLYSFLNLSKEVFSTPDFFLLVALWVWLPKHEQWSLPFNVTQFCPLRTPRGPHTSVLLDDAHFRLFLYPSLLVQPLAHLRVLLHPALRWPGGCFHELWHWKGRKERGYGKQRNEEKMELTATLCCQGSFWGFRVKGQTVWASRGGCEVQVAPHWRQSGSHVLPTGSIRVTFVIVDLFLY